MKSREREDEFSYRLALLHEARDGVLQAEEQRADRRSRVGKFFAGLGVARAENILHQRELLYDEILLASNATNIEQNSPEAPPRLESL